MRIRTANKRKRRNDWNNTHLWNKVCVKYINGQWFSYTTYRNYPLSHNDFTYNITASNEEAALDFMCAA